MKPKYIDQGEPWVTDPIPAPAAPVPAPSTDIHGIPSPNPASVTWPYVLAFAYAMEFKLSQNRRKGGWRALSLEILQAKLDDEVEELDRALADFYLRYGKKNHKPLKEVVLEAADVANFAMMIADVTQVIAQTQEI